MPLFQNMRSVHDHRRMNLRQLMADWGGPTALAARLGHSNGSFVAQLAGPHPSREVSEKVARDIESKLELPAGWMDVVDHSATPLDEVLLARSIQAVTLCAGDLGKTLSYAAMAEVVALVYDHANAHGGACEEPFVHRLLRLVG